MQHTVPGYCHPADMEPITASLAVQQQSEQGTVLTKAVGKQQILLRLQRETTKLLHDPASPSTGSLRHNSWGPAYAGGFHTSLFLLCFLRYDAAHHSLGNYITSPPMGYIAKNQCI